MALRGFLELHGANIWGFSVFPTGLFGEILKIRRIGVISFAIMYCCRAVPTTKEFGGSPVRRIRGGGLY